MLPEREEPPPATPPAKEEEPASCFNNTDMIPDNTTGSSGSSSMNETPRASSPVAEEVTDRNVGSPAGDVSDTSDNVHPPGDDSSTVSVGELWVCVGL
jgi:hypothetical protein